jgi:hypothetical protein
MATACCSVSSARQRGGLPPSPAPGPLLALLPPPAASKLPSLHAVRSSPRPLAAYISHANAFTCSPLSQILVCSRLRVAPGMDPSYGRESENGLDVIYVVYLQTILRRQCLSYTQPINLVMEYNFFSSRPLHISLLIAL